ncbi:MAG: tail fiber domain-containing protein [Acetobacter sp.]|nr:tail fiber domain-containing protein [Acetobacter sp.]
MFRPDCPIRVLSGEFKYWEDTIYDWELDNNTDDYVAATEGTFEYLVEFSRDKKLTVIVSYFNSDGVRITRCKFIKKTVMSYDTVTFSLFTDGCTIGSVDVYNQPRLNVSGAGVVELPDTSGKLMVEEEMRRYLEETPPRKLEPNNAQLETYFSEKYYGAPTSIPVWGSAVGPMDWITLTPGNSFLLDIPFVDKGEEIYNGVYCNIFLDALNSSENFWVFRPDAPAIVTGGEWDYWNATIFDWNSYFNETGYLATKSGTFRFTLELSSQKIFRITIQTYDDNDVKVAERIFFTRKGVEAEKLLFAFLRDGCSVSSTRYRSYFSNIVFPRKRETTYTMPQESGELALKTDLPFHTKNIITLGMDLSGKTLYFNTQARYMVNYTTSTVLLKSSGGYTINTRSGPPDVQMLDSSGNVVVAFTHWSSSDVWDYSSYTLPDDFGTVTEMLSSTSYKPLSDTMWLANAGGKQPILFYEEGTGTVLFKDKVPEMSISPCFSFSIGINSTLNSSHCWVVRLGCNIANSGYQSTALGHSSNSAGTGSTALGYSANAHSMYSLAAGSGALVNGYSGVALGYGAKALLNAGIAIGSWANSAAIYSIAIGNSSRALNSGAIAIGNDANAAGMYSVVIGEHANANFYGTALVGYASRATGNYGVALGYYANAGCNCVSIGYYANTNTNDAVAIGWNAFASQNSTAIGHNARANQFSLAVGANAGNQTTTSGYYTAVGRNAKAGYYGTALGYGANASNYAVAIGASANANVANSVVLGNASTTSLRCAVTSITSLSDERTKEEIEVANIARCLEDVERLPVKRFKFRSWARPNQIDVHRTGFIAQDVEKVFPKDVQIDPDTFPVLDDDGKPIMIEAKDDEGNVVYEEDGVTPKLIEKTFTIEDCKKISMADGLPTLWGAVQYLSGKVKSLAKELEAIKGASK